MKEIKQSFIFAAGRGERMRPITDSVAKPLVEVKNKAIIDYVIEKIDEVGEIKKIVVNGFYLANQIENHLRKLNNDKIVFSCEEAKIETGGGLLFAAKNKLIDEKKPILTANGDVLWQGEGDIKKLIDAYKTSDCEILLGLTKTENFFGYQGNGDFDLASNGDLIGVGDGYKKSHTFVGLQISDLKILQKAPSDAFSLAYFYKNAKDLGIKIKGFELDSKFFHIGDVPSFEAVNEVFNN